MEQSSRVRRITGAMACMTLLASVSAGATPPAGTSAMAPAAAPAAVRTPRTGAPANRCDRPLPLPATGNERFEHFRNRAFLGGAHAARHRGRDAFFAQGEAQVLSAKFAYGAADRDLQDEAVDVYVLRDCRTWEAVGRARTSRNGATVAVGNGRSVRDGGRVSLTLPTARALAPGMHRVRFVVRGDRTTADAVVTVLAPNERFVVSDVDGTLTVGEFANTSYHLGLRREPGPNAGAAATLRALAARGYRVFYLTGRPDWTARSTHAWLARHGFPVGVLRTRPAGLGFGGPDTTVFKSEELQREARRFGHAADYALGNSHVDVAAYRAGGVLPERRFFYRFEGDVLGGVRHGDYVSLATRFEREPSDAPGASRMAEAARTDVPQS